MAARTLDNCRLVTAYGRPRQYDGKCEGYGVDYANDEPLRYASGANCIISMRNQKN